MKNEVEKNIYIQSQTGTGKTMSLISTALEADIYKNHKIIYCTRTHKQIDNVIKTFQKCNKNDKCRASFLSSHQKLCNYKDCTRAKHEQGHIKEIMDQYFKLKTYSRVALKQLLA